MNRVCGNHGHQSRRRRDAALGENGAQFFQRAFDAHPRGVFVETEFRADFGELPVFKVAQQNGFAVGFLEFVHGVVERQAKFFPIGFGRGLGRLEACPTFVSWFAHKFFLAVAAAVFSARDFCGGKMRAGVKPAGQSFAA
ncbi:MAG TPA: hypothetical protein VGH42_14995 [Verrucomicrobiae bacterium]